MTAEEFTALPVAKAADVVPGTLLVFQYSNFSIELCVIKEVQGSTVTDLDALLLWSRHFDDDHLYDVTWDTGFRVLWSPAREEVVP